MNAEERALEAYREMLDRFQTTNSRCDDVTVIKGAIRAAQREAMEKPKKQLQKCADWLMSAQGYLPPESRGTLAVEFKRMKECEDETRALIKKLGKE